MDIQSIIIYQSSMCRIILLLGLSLFVSCTVDLDDPDSTVVRPNILWISVEDISPYLPMYGDSTVTTPNIDRIARGGTVYTNAFAAAGVCAPSRSAIITGMHPETLGTMHMRTGRDYVGISHGVYKEDIGLLDPSGKNVPEYSAVIPPEIKVFTEYMRKEGYFCSNNAKTDYQFAPPITAWDENGMDGHWRNRGEGEPFFHVRSTFVTHESRIWAKKNDSLLVDPSIIPIPEYFPNTPTVRQDVARNYSNIKEVDIQIGQLLDQIENDGLADRTIVVFWSDHGGPLPRGKREVYDTGIHVPMIIRVPPYMQQHVLGYEVKYNERRYDDQMISLIDLAPSMLSIVGIEPPNYMQGKAFLGTHRVSEERKYIYAGRDRLDTEYDKVRVIRDKDFLYVKNYYPESPNYMNVEYRTQMDMMQELLQLNQKGVLNGKTATWFNQTKPEEEFYVVSDDPLQLNNVISDSAYVKEIIRMRFALDMWESNLNDRSDVMESALVEEMWPGLIQPTTAAPKISVKENIVSISSSTEGASIAYQFSDDAQPSEDWDDWSVYDHSMVSDSTQYLHTKAIRIGYKESEVMSQRL